MNDAKERQQESKNMLETMLQGIEQAPQEEVAAQILMLQTRLQASLQTTAMLYQTEHRQLSLRTVGASVMSAAKFSGPAGRPPVRD